MTVRLDEVWYATPDRARSRTKWIVYDDVGSLAVEDSMLFFRGTTVTIERRVESVSFTRQRANLVTYLLVALMAFPIFFGIAYVLHTIFAVSLIFGILGCYSVAPVGLLIGWSTRWIRVTFSPEPGKPNEAYFADGGSQGWRGILGGTRRLFLHLSNPETSDAI